VHSPLLQQDKFFVRLCPAPRMRVYETWNTWRRLMSNVGRLSFGVLGHHSRRAFVGTFVPSGGIWAYCRHQKMAVPKTFIFDISRFNSESQRFRRLNCAKSRLNFYDAERLLLFGFATCALARVSTIFRQRRLFGLATDPAVAIRINLVQRRCNRSVLN